MSDLTEKQAQEIFSENLKKAVSRCDELRRLTSNITWNKMAQQLEILRQRGEAAYRSASISETAKNRRLDAIIARTATDAPEVH